jgi:hypothetical protein
MHERVCLHRFLAQNQYGHAVTVHKGLVLRNCSRWVDERSGCVWTLSIGTGLLFCDAGVFEVATEGRPSEPEQSVPHQRP